MVALLGRRWAGMARGLSGALSVIIIVIPGPDGSSDQNGGSTGEAGATNSAPSADQGAGSDAGGSGDSSSSSGDSAYQSVQLVSGKGETVRVSDAESLTQALASAKPGQTIELADGTYQGKFVINTAGEQGNPITLKGSRQAVLTGGDSGTGYDVHLDGADYWQLVGFSVSGLEKGIMTDNTNHTVLSGLAVGNTGAEAVHFGNFSSDNVIQDSEIHDTGKSKPQFGEGVYFGTAKSNWSKKSGGQPDKSNNNKALNNTFKSITAENIDVKEETSGGVIAGNKFDGSAISGENFADSVLDIKGTNYHIVNNATTGSSAKLLDGFQTHVITGPETSGCNNRFANNVFDGVRFSGGQEIAVDKKCGGEGSGSASSDGSKSDGKSDKKSAKPDRSDKSD